jgi:hypothetical protein
MPVDITVVIKLHHDQAMAGNLMVHRMRLLTNRQISLIHLATLIALKNDLQEEEWSNFEFYPCQKTTQVSDLTIESLSSGGTLRPFKYKYSVHEILQVLYPGEEDQVVTLDLVYKKKPLPQLMNQKTLIKQL